MVGAGVTFSATDPSGAFPLEVVEVELPRIRRKNCSRDTFNNDLGIVSRLRYSFGSA
jgi:hypothetical protein